MVFKKVWDEAQQCNDDSAAKSPQSIIITKVCSIRSVALS